MRVANMTYDRNENLAREEERVGRIIEEGGMA